MPMWRCPHCGTPQAETSRCWVCRRSSTACGTCRHFRRSVAAKVGYCGLDRRRSPLAGDEIRACWEAGAPPEVTSLPVVPVFGQPVEASRTLDFVEVAGGAQIPSATAPALTPAIGAAGLEPLFEVPPAPATAGASGDAPWSLWSDLEA